MHSTFVRNFTSITTTLQIRYSSIKSFAPTLSTHSKTKASKNSNNTNLCIIFINYRYNFQGVLLSEPTTTKNTEPEWHITSHKYITVDMFKHTHLYHDVRLFGISTYERQNKHTLTLRTYGQNIIFNGGHTCSLSFFLM